MTLPELSIKRHVLAYMVSALLVLFGIISFNRVGIDRFPSVEVPMVSITTVMPGVNPDIVDSSITGIIESAVNSVPGINHIQSTSSPGVSVVMINFDLDKNVDVGFNELQAKVNQAQRLLPEDAQAPIVAKVEVGASPIMWLALQGDRTQQQLNQYARNVIKKKLETINGVGEVRLGGKRDRTIRVELDLQRMTALKLTAQDIVNAFRNEHLQLPAGFIVSEATETMLKLDLEYHRVDDLEQLIITARDGMPIKLGDIATIEDGLGDFRQLAHFNAKSTVGIGIVKIANTNTVAIIDEVKRRMQADIIPQLPPGLVLNISTDDSAFILEMIDALKEHLVLATILAALVVLLFLKSFRSTIIISLAIPVSLLGAIAVIYFGGFTLNTMTLLALLLLVGVVVDDAIVVLENIYRHRELYEADSMKAAINGTKEVVFAVLAATLSLVAIFAPVIFISGMIGRFFESFAVVVVFGVLVSWFVSMTLTPMLCSRYLKIPKQHGKVYTWLENIFRRFEDGYSRALVVALEHRWKIVIATLVIVLSSGFFFAKVGKGFVPDEDEGRFMVIFKTPLGSSINYTTDRMAEVEKVLGEEKQVGTYFTAVGLGQAGQVNQGMAFVRLKPRHERKEHQKAIVERVSGKLFKIPGVRAFAMQIPMVSGGGRGDPLQFNITGPNLGEVANYAKILQGKLNAIPDLGRVDLDVQLDLPQAEPVIDRTRLAQLGLSTRDVGTALQVLAGGIDIARYSDSPGDGERYDIRVKAKESDIANVDDLKRIYLKSRNGDLVRLDSVVQFKESLGAAVISRFDLEYAANFYSTPKIALGDAVNRVKQEAESILPFGYRVQFVGQAEEFGKTAGYMAFTFVLAMVMLYMVLASQFNSFLQPFVIMMAQPLAMIGGVAALWLFDHTLNIYSMIGMILLIGLVAKNSILLVDLTNQFREDGKDLKTAILQASPIRLRPILMTSLTVIAALFPAALGLGAGADTNGPLSVSVIGGMITSTLLTLIVIPVVYSLLDDGVNRAKSWATRRKATNLAQLG